MVNTKSIQLDYDIAEVGSSKVKSVEVWYTQDGRTWKKTPEDAKPEPPYVVKVPTEGRYGFTLIARSGVGLGLPAPKTGDQPQVWVEVDTTKPTVNILGVEVGRGPDMGTLTVRWTATDAHMAASPDHDFLRGRGGRGDGSVAADDAPAPIPNDGRYTWRIPEGLPPANPGARGGGRSGGQRRRRRHGQPGQHRPVDPQGARQRRSRRRRGSGGDDAAGVTPPPLVSRDAERSVSSKPSLRVGLV